MTKHVTLPPIRKLILPDPGYMLFDCDQSGADAQVVAWEAQDKSLMEAFKAGLDIHNFNGETIFGSTYKPDLVRRKLTWRDEMKRGVHGTNYLSGVPGLATALGWRTSEVLVFQQMWWHSHPGIKEWHRRVEFDIQKSRKVTNSFGYHIVYFDRPSNILPKAVAWIPQSTVANITEKAAIQLNKHLPWCEVMFQVHDSVVFQIPYHRVTISNMLKVKSCLEVPAPYKPEPLVIPWGLKNSKTSWGDLGPKLDWNTLEPKRKLLV